jgi:NAD(P)-dependent dehydrogenase (short-subunit alcohol dehydrogenase family)
MSGARRVVAVTGASAGVGRAIVRAFADDGADVGLIARNREALEAAQAEVAQRGGRAVVCVADVADARQVAEAAETIERTLGPIDVWVNDAMVTIVAPVSEITPEEFRRVTEVTYLGAVYGTLEALRRMRARDRGVIIQIGSALAYRAIPLQAPYCGAKFALRGFTDSLRTELMHEGSKVRVTMLQLPAVNTPQFDWCRTRMPRVPRPVPPVFQPELIGRCALWASRHPRREVTIGWPALKAIWATKLLPGLADRYLARFGCQSQMGARAVSAGRPDNLWHAVPGDAGAHGRFDAEARPSSLQWWLNRHRGGLGALVLGVAAAAAARRFASKRLPG